MMCFESVSVKFPSVKSSQVESSRVSSFPGETVQNEMKQQDHDTTYWKNKNKPRLHKVHVCKHYKTVR